MRPIFRLVELRAVLALGFAGRVPRRRADNGSAVPSGHTASQRGPAAARVLQQLRPRLSAGRGGHRCVRLRLRRNAALYGSYCRSAAGWFPVPFLWWLRPAVHHGTKPAASPDVPPLAQLFTEAVTGSFLAVLNICAFVLFFMIALRLLSLTACCICSLPLWKRRCLLWHDRASVHRFLRGFSNYPPAQPACRARRSPAPPPWPPFSSAGAGCRLHYQSLLFVLETDLSCKPYFVGKFLQGLFPPCWLCIVHRFPCG